MGNHSGFKRTYGNFQDEESALAEAMNFRIACEVQRAGNRDRERIWAGDLQRKYSDTATNCTALNVVNEHAFKVLKANPSKILEGIGICLPQLLICQLLIARTKTSG